jgi:hypothetical protein
MHTIALLFIMLCCTSPIFAQTKQSQAPEGITTIDFVKIASGREAEARFFYENNWLVFRKEALKRRFIAGYQLLAVKDSTADYDAMLITHYRDSTQYAAIEKRFSEVMKEIQPSGLKLLNSFKPRDITTIVRSHVGKTIYVGTQQK